MSHTQGPWKVTSNKLQCFIDGPNGEEVAQCLGDADARLIAAAPELLEALKSAERVLQTQVRCEFNAGAPPTGTYHHTKLLEIQAAIAKAEGKLAL